MPITTTTVAAFRKSKAKPADAYIITDAGPKASLWFPAAAGSVDIDNGGTFLRNALGAGIERQYEGLRHASMFGMRPGMDIRERLQRYVSDLTEGEYGTALALSHGIYEASNVLLGSTALNFVCTSGHARLRGERILRADNGQGRVLRFSNVGLLGYGKKDYGQVLDDNDRRLMDNALLYSNGVIHIAGHCSFLEGAGHLVVAEGWELPDRPLTNVSGSLIEAQNLFSRASGRAIYIVGNNANACVVHAANDVRDNTGGVRDNSQVGGLIMGNMFHLNAGSGDVVMDGAGTTGTVQANYYEERHSGRTNQYGNQARVRDAHRNGVPEVGPNVDFKDANHPFAWRQEESGSFGLYPKDGSPRPILQYGTEYNALKRPATNEVRRLPAPWLNVPLLGAGGRFSYQADTLGQAQKADVFYQPGDPLTIRYPAEGEATTYVVETGGNGGRALSGILAGVGPSSGSQLVVAVKGQKPWGEVMPEDAPVPDELKALIGTVVGLGDYVVRVWDVKYDKNNGFKIICPNADLISITDGNYPSGELRYPEPVFKAL